MVGNLPRKEEVAIKFLLLSDCNYGQFPQRITLLVISTASCTRLALIYQCVTTHAWVLNGAPVNSQQDEQ